ncbi:MAG: macro domain-containing protein [Acidobacteria bacterium]|nr:MAG: macro domain-containing protein [Acidobacteriota bacterium]REK00462.1 MAG: macro domain-containing protein [Acidobacteriota bacterium]
MNDTLLDLVEGDITEMDVEAIVNPSNPDLKMGGGGVSKAILKKGGKSIQEECERIGGAAVGTAVMTGAGNLPHKQVIHAVGPKKGEGDEDRKLASAVRSSLALADRNGLKSIAIPAISAGAYGFPLARCARILLTEVHRYLQGGTKLETVIVCLHDEETYKKFRQELRRGFR